MTTRALCLLATMLCACSSGTASPSAPMDAGVASDSAASDSAITSDASDDVDVDDADADAAPGDTWTSYVAGFMTKYCVECHNPADTLRDYGKLADVVRDKSLIRCGVAPTKQPGCSGIPAAKQFPISNSSATNPKPTDAERARIVAWIDAGTP